MKKRNRLLLVVLILGLAITAFGCGNNEPGPQAETPQEPGTGDLTKYGSSYTRTPC